MCMLLYDVTNSSPQVWCGVVEGPGLTGVWWQSGEVVSSL